MRKHPYRMRRGDRYPDTLRDLFETSTKKYSKCLSGRFTDGSQEYTYARFHEVCDRESLRLSRYGISSGDKVAIFAQNMPNWTLAFFAATAFGRVAIPILPDSSENEVTNILRHSESKVIYISQKLLPKLSRECIDKLTLVIDIETLKPIKKDEEAFQCDGLVKAPTADELAAIIYTSGTTGNAKGVMLSHRNFCHNIMASHKAEKCSSKDRFLSMGHTYELAIGCLYPFYVGACVYYIKKAPTPSVLSATMKELRPTVMCSVPLIIEKVYKRSIVPTVENSRTLTWMSRKMPYIFHKLVGQRLYKSFGGKLHFFGIGGSKLDPVVEDFLKKCRFPYAIGYGLTECAPLVCNAMVGRTSVGSIGIPAFGVDVRLIDVNPKTGEGEIVCRGDNVMLGYYKDPERTMGVIDDEGWFHTNDIASMDKNGNYYIRGRLNNTILGASGENIYPEEIEQLINSEEGVSESLVVERDGKLVALVKFEDNVLDWNFEGEEKFYENLEARTASLKERVNKLLGKNSQVSEVNAMKEPFEKTATQKIRRFLYKNKKQ